MTPVILREPPFAAEIRLRLERNRFEALERVRVGVPESRQRIRRRRLPVVAHALGEGGLQSVIRGLARMDAHRRIAPSGIDSPRTISGGVVGAGGRVEGQVDVVDDIFFVPPLRIHVVGLDRYRSAKLPLYTDCGLPCSRHVDEVERSAELLERTRQAGRRAGEAAGLPCSEVRRLGRRVTERRQCLFVGGQTLPVGGVERKVGAAVVRVFEVGDLGVAGGEREVCADRIPVVQPRAAADNGAIG